MSKEQFDKSFIYDELNGMHSSKIRFDNSDHSTATKLHNLLDWINKHPILFMFSRKKILSKLTEIEETQHIAHCVATDCFNHCDLIFEHLECVYDIDKLIGDDYKRPSIVDVNFCPVCKSFDIGVKDNISDNKVWAYCRCCRTKGPVLNRDQFHSDDELIRAAYNAWDEQARTYKKEHKA